MRSRHQHSLPETQTFSAQRHFFITTTAATTTSFQDNNSSNNIRNQNINDTTRRPISGSDTNNSNNNHNNWHPLLYISPWEQQIPVTSRQEGEGSHYCFLQPLDSAPAVDVASRHLIQLLQEVYHYGHANVRSGGSISHHHGNADHVPLSRCHEVLQSLVALPVHVTGRAQRADAILVLLQLIDEKQQRANAAATASIRLGDNNNNKRQDSHLLYRSAFAHLGPNQETYKIVLQLYAQETMVKGPSSSSSSSNTTAHHDNDNDEDDSTTASLTIPLRAQELIQQMQNEYQVHGNLEIKPHAYHYNRVLLCWKDCYCHHAPQKVVLYATQFFLQNIQDMDATSYVLIMKICSSSLDRSHHHDHHNNTSAQQQHQQQAAILGARAAIRIWQVTMEQQHEQAQLSQKSASSSPVLDLPSHFYSHFLQAIRPLSDDTGKDDFELRKEYYGKCFLHARDHGKLNAYILQEFLIHVQSKNLTERLLGQDLMQVIYGVTPTTRAVQVLLENMPSSWKQHAN